ncbi:ABC transporter substrate-binding protein [Cohnella sp. CFH 77786]|uniref:ABC transporter substrate-binding protein n=1 Tax=Cohnella sp. CFH 77786 TaxID=2662265 RepID=UPI001C60B1B3|nr:ABC transporter substrate-binding protein [Cohnella sp. CFH 77786]MBW5448711.1 ABC transporter substrate-binding protein [Cohnella sp. CFH 77786]
MNEKRKTASVLLSFLLLALVAACGGKTEPAGPASESVMPSAAPSATPSAEATPKQVVTVKFSEVIRSIFYAPHYAAMSKGFYEEEGIRVDMNTAQGSDKGAAALIAGTADISMVGPETAIYIYNQKGGKTLKIFHQLTMKDGSFLLSRNKVDSFKWSDLSGKTIIGWRPGSSPQMVMNSQLAKEGVKDAKVITNIAAPAMVGAFTNGQGDFIQVFEPVASMLVNTGKAYYAASLGESYGTFPETSFVATSDFIRDRPDVIQGFVNAVAKGQRWLGKASPDEIADALMPYFEGTSKELILASVERYKKQDTWPAVPELTPEAFETLQNVLIDNGVLKREEKLANMADVVDMSFVRKIGQEGK